MRKTILGICVLLALTSIARAAGSNQTMNIQGVLRDAAGTLQSMAVGIDVNLYVAKDSTMPFYTQHFTTVPVDDGFFSVELSDAKLSFSGLPDVWVGVQVAGDAMELPRQHLGAAPYAFSAASLDPMLCSGCVQDGMVATLSGSKVTGKVAAATNADQLGGVPASGYVTTSGNQTINDAKNFAGSVGIGTTTPREKLEVYGAISLVGNRSATIFVNSPSANQACTVACGTNAVCLAAFIDGATGGSGVGCDDTTFNKVCLCAGHNRQ
jgi:hypothetical protein